MCKKILDLLNSENANNIFLFFSPPKQQESSNKNKKPPTTKQETSNKNKKPPTENHETSNNFPELICGRIWARFPNRGRSRETKCKRIWSCFLFVSSVLYLFQNTSHIVTSNKKQETSNRKPSNPPTTFMSWYVVKYEQDSQTEVGAERPNVGLSEAVLGLFVRCLVSSKSLSECYLRFYIILVCERQLWLCRKTGKT